jgi:hypothetical protein
MGRIGRYDEHSATRARFLERPRRRARGLSDAAFPSKENETWEV